MCNESAEEKVRTPVELSLSCYYGGSARLRLLPTRLIDSIMSGYPQKL
jgi:hypothetical protein